MSETKPSNGLEDVEIIRNLGDFRTYWTIEINKKLTKRQAQYLAMKIKALIIW